MFNTVSLFDMIKNKIGKEEIMKYLSSFYCPLNPSVEYFIKNKAYDFERVGLARTYLIFKGNKTQSKKLVAIYVLGMSNVEINENFSSAEKRKIFGTTYPLGKNVKTLLIGQLAKNYSEGNDAYISGDMLMHFIFSRIKEIHKMFPSVVTHIDCEDNENLRTFYEKNGFRLLLKKGNNLVYVLSTNSIFNRISDLQQR